MWEKIIINLIGFLIILVLAFFISGFSVWLIYDVLLCNAFEWQPIGFWKACLVGTAITILLNWLKN